MKMKFAAGMFGTGKRMKVLALLTLCAVCAMAWTFVQVGKQVSVDQSRLANVSEELVLSQQLAKFALAATSGDSDAFSSMEKTRNRFSQIIDDQIKDFGTGRAAGKTPEGMALISLDNRWRGFRTNIDAVLNGQFLILAMTEAGNLMNEVMPQLMEHTQAIVDTLVKEGASASG
jgi:twitching motility protein PilJ